MMFKIHTHERTEKSTKTSSSTRACSASRRCAPPTSPSRSSAKLSKRYFLRSSA